jgi:hypothetical protein
MGKIEIFLNTQAYVDVGFWIQKAKWDALDDEGKRKKIGEILNIASLYFADDVIRLEDDDNTNVTYISASIQGPMEYEIELDQVKIYDPDM